MHGSQRDQSEKVKNKWDLVFLQETKLEVIAVGW
jgi:hypothetical protein